MHGRVQVLNHNEEMEIKQCIGRIISGNKNYKKQFYQFLYHINNVWKKSKMS